MLCNNNISYFLGFEAEGIQAQRILAGDRNLTTNGVAVPSGLLNLSTNWTMGWSKKMHQDVGNLGLADGSVMQVDAAGLQRSVVAADNGTNRVAIP
jgi:hypothetical protein